MLLQDVRIFDGKSDALSAPTNVLVRGNKIEKISTDPVLIGDDTDVTTIDGSGRTLMPGLIDMHWHAMLVRPNPVEAMALVEPHVRVAGYLVGSANSSPPLDVPLKPPNFRLFL